MTTQTAWKQDGEVGEGGSPYLYQEDGRLIVSDDNTQAGQRHGVLGGKLKIKDGQRDPQFDRVYVEMVQFGNRSNTDVAWGLCDAKRRGTSELGISLPDLTFAITQDGVIIFKDESDETIPNTDDGDVHMLALDFQNALLYFGVNGTWVIGDPAIGSGGKPLDPKWKTDTSVGVHLRAQTRALGGQPTVGWLIPSVSNHKPSAYNLWPAVDS